MIYLILFYEFAKIGIFALGGGLASIPFLYQLAEKYSWFDVEMLSNMIAVSESTPGPIGINMATYAGFQAAGILGGVVATFGTIAPGLIITMAVAKMLSRFKDNFYVKAAFYGIRPVVTGLILYACYQILTLSVFELNKFTTVGNILDIVSFPKLILFFVALFLVLKYKKHPIVYISGAAVVGIFLKL